MTGYPDNEPGPAQSFQKRLGGRPASALIFHHPIAASCTFQNHLFVECGLKIVGLGYGLPTIHEIGFVLCCRQAELCRRVPEIRLPIFQFGAALHQFLSLRLETAE